MPKKQSAARRRGIPAMASSSAFNATAVGDNDPQLARALQESKAMAAREREYQSSLSLVLEQSKQESEEAEALRLAMEASLAAEEERIVAIGLGLQATAILVNSTLAKAGSSEVAAARTEVATTSAKDSSSSPQQFEARTQSMLATHTLKVTLGNDMRRLHVEWPRDAPASAVFECIRSTVERAFGLSLGASTSYTLKYFDEESDLCTLVEDTALDFLGIYQHRTALKLSLETSIMAEVGIASDHAAAHDDIEDRTRPSPRFVDFSIATPPETPRLLQASSIEEDYEDVWALVDSVDT